MKKNKLLLVLFCVNLVVKNFVLVYNKVMEKLFVIDGNSLINRAYFALPPLSASDGHVYNAVFGFVNTLIKLLDENNPSHLVVAFDAGKKTFRNELFADYKATRKGMPDELRFQLEPLKSLLKKMNICCIEKLGIEADDIIGTITKNSPIPCVIVTGDRDALQLIDNKTEVWLTKHGISEIVSMNERQLLEEWGLTPSQVVDLKGLMGDASDNIPGVPGVGEKTAKTLLEKYKTLDGVFENLNEIQGKLKEKLENGQDLARLSFVLATIKTDCDIDFNLDNCKVKMPFSHEVFEDFAKYEFSSLLKRKNLFSENFGQKQESLPQIETKKVTNFDFLTGDVVAIFETENGFLFSTNKTNVFEFDGTLDDILPILENKNLTKIVHQSKPLLHKTNGKLAFPVFDLSLATYLVNSNTKNEDPQKMQEFLGVTLPLSSASFFECYEILKQKIEQLGMTSLYFDVELPISRILFLMEQSGICVDENVLDELSKKYATELETMTKGILELAGQEFNINSPKQLAKVLFEDLGLPDTQNKKHSTAEEKLELLKDKHPIVLMLLNYRKLAKLKSTYVDGLRPFVKNGKVHTTFKQTLTVTGRLSSIDPNLQNLPVRSVEGKDIRRIYCASPNCVLMSADYSQIELRLLAHYSNDSTLVNAYKNNQDIHTTTASQIFGIPFDDVNDNQRRKAKAVNFGIIYGISAFGLSKNAQISVKEASEYIDAYFKTYPTIKSFLESSVEQAKSKGYVTTLLGRRRNIAEIFSLNHNTAMFGERAAMNMPLQGTASDIIKLAMIKIQDELEKQNLKSKLVLQIHDELVFDVPENEKDIMEKLVKNCMENVVKLNVPLVAKLSFGKNYAECK